MENKLKRAVESIELPEDAAARIRDNLSSAPAAKPRRRLRGRTVIAAAAAAALLITGAGAAYLQVFRNSEIVGGVEDIPEPTFRNSGILDDLGPEIAVSYSRPNADFGAPRTLDDGAEPIWKLYASFGTDERLGGPLLPGIRWTHSEVVCGSGSVLVRDVYGEGGYVKRDYFPEDPALVAGEFPFVCVDYGALGRLASPVPESCHGAVIKDRRGRPCESSICCCYEAGAEGGWFRFDFYNLAGREWSGNNYIFEGDYDEAYVYTNAEGLEFVITALDNRVDAECTTAHTSIMITSYFMSTTELEAVLDCIGLPQ